MSTPDPGTAGNERAREQAGRTGRPEIDANLVSRMISAQFPHWADLPVTEVRPGGWDNRTFRLGRQLSVRLPSDQGYVPQVAKEHRWLQWLGPQLPLPIPELLARGIPGQGYPYPWSVCRWIEGESAATASIVDVQEFADALARFLAVLQQIHAATGPPPGLHTGYRGGPLAVYDVDTRNAVVSLGGLVPGDAALAVWDAALAAAWCGPPVWFHGDVAAGNLLVRGGRPAAVIDFGCAGVGDPACDLAVAWTMFSGAGREAFRAALPMDPATWARGRGWALWKALITVAGEEHRESVSAVAALRVISDVIADHGRADRRPLDR